MTSTPFLPDPDQARAFERLLAGRSVALMGAPGSGKSRLINEYLHRTGKAALRLTTQPWGLQGPGELPLREALGLAQGRVTAPGRLWLSRELREELPAFQVVVIDEVGGLRVDEAQAVRDLLFASARGLGEQAGYQVILAGDFATHRPAQGSVVQTHLAAHYGDKLHAFDSRLWAGLEVCRLGVPHRFAADPDLAQAVLRVSLGDEAALAVLNERVGEPEPQAVRLVPKEGLAQRLNAEAAGRLGPKGYRIEGTVFGQVERGYPVPYEMRLQPGARVVLLGPQGDLGRGTTATFQRAVRLPTGEAAAEIETDGGSRRTVQPRFWPSRIHDAVPNRARGVLDGLLQLPLRLGWAVSLPASRGMTFARVHLDPRDFRAPGELHAALTRCGTRAGLSLAAPLEPADLRIDGAIRAFQMRHLGRTEPEPAPVP